MQVPRCQRIKIISIHPLGTMNAERVTSLTCDNSGVHCSSSRDNECHENQVQFGPMWWKHWLHHNTKGDWKMYFKAAALPPRRRCILPRHQRKCRPDSPFRYNHRYTVQMLGCSSSLSLNNGCFFYGCVNSTVVTTSFAPASLCSARHLAAAEFKINLPQTAKKASEGEKRGADIFHRYLFPWFLNNLLEAFPENYCYLVPITGKIEAIIQDVHLLKD